MIECQPGIYFFETSSQKDLVLTAPSGNGTPTTIAPRAIDSTYPNQLWKVKNNQTIALNSVETTVLALPTLNAKQVTDV